MIIWVMRDDVFEYTNVVIECVPQAPISGVHTFRVRAQKPSQHLTVSLDKTHFIPALGPWPAQAANPGVLLFDQDGDFQSFFPVTLDTTLLADGWHTLAVVSTGPFGSSSDCDYCDPSTINFPSSVAKIWFYVQNAPPTNQPPHVDAGDDQAILLGASATLAGMVFDDGLPDAVVTAEWLVDSGPGDVAFADPMAIQTSAAFSQLGVYVLSLNLDDGLLAASDTVRIVVNSLAHAESDSGGSADSASVSTAGSLSGTEGFFVASISTKPHVDVTGLSGLGLNWIALRSQCAARGQTGISVWTADGVPASAGPVTAQLGKAPLNAVISVSRYSGSVSLGRVLSGDTSGIGGACSGGTDSGLYDFAMLPAPDDDTLVFSAAATRQAAHAAGSQFVPRDRLIHGSGGSAAGIATQDTPASSIQDIVVDGTFGWELDWAVVAFELQGNAAPPAPNANPAAAFGYICDGLGCNFTDGSSDDDGTIASRSWSFGDTGSSTATYPSHTDAEGGSYAVRLTVTDNDGASDSVAHQVMVTAPSLPPAAPTSLTATVESSGKGKKKVVTGVVLRWADNADNEEFFVLERCQQTGKGRNKTCVFAGIATVGPNITSFSDSPGNGAYKYRVKAGNAAGDSAYSNVVKI